MQTFGFEHGFDDRMLSRYLRASVVDLSSSDRSAVKWTQLTCRRWRSQNRQRHSAFPLNLTHPFLQLSRRAFQFNRTVPGALSGRQRRNLLTDDDLDLIGGKRDKLVGKLQERYGIAKDQAERESDEWVKVVVEEELGQVRSARTWRIEILT